MRNELTYFKSSLKLHALKKKKNTNHVLIDSSIMKPTSFLMILEMADVRLDTFHLKLRQSNLFIENNRLGIEVKVVHIGFRPVHPLELDVDVGISN